MGVVTARLVFLAFLGLTGTIIYNALYLQEHGPRGAATASTTARKVTSDGQASFAAEPANESEVSLSLEPPAGPKASSMDQPKGGVPPVSTDLPPLDPEAGESQLVVRAVQRELAARGYDVGQVDGNLSDKTRAAISAYESSQGLPVTGAPSDELLRQILLGDSVAESAATGSVAADSIAAKAVENDTIKTVQQILADLGYSPGPIDGAWGTNTSRAISAFQRDRNIAETGRITPEVLNEFRRVTGRDLTKTAAKP
jgi:peptidoglycan hydrolase-like protein with peptidoglycan-binding domain